MRRNHHRPCQGVRTAHLCEQPPEQADDHKSEAEVDWGDMRFPTSILLAAILFFSSPAKEASMPTVRRCAQWMSTAMMAGWTAAQLPVLDYILWKESRCDPDQINKTLNRDGSWDYGLAQINDRSWCKPNRWYTDGYLQSLEIIDYCNDLLVPINNLKAAKALYDYTQKNLGNGFQPWGL